MVEQDFDKAAQHPSTHKGHNEPLPMNPGCVFHAPDGKNPQEVGR